MFRLRAIDQQPRLFVGMCDDRIGQAIAIDIDRPQGAANVNVAKVVSPLVIFYRFKSPRTPAAENLQRLLINAILEIADVPVGDNEFVDPIAVKIDRFGPKTNQRQRWAHQANLAGDVSPNSRRNLVVKNVVLQCKTCHIKIQVTITIKITACNPHRCLGKRSTVNRKTANGRAFTERLIVALTKLEVRVWRHVIGDEYSHFGV